LFSAAKARKMSSFDRKGFKSKVGKTWSKLEMKALGAPKNAPESRKTDFSPALADPLADHAAFIPFPKGGQRSLREEAEAILRKAEERASHLEIEGYEKGFAQGEKDGSELGTKKAMKVIEKMETLLRSFSQMREDIIRQHEREILALILSVLKKILHDQVVLDEKVIRETVLQALTVATDRSTVSVRLNPEDCVSVENLKADFFSRIKELRTLKIVQDPSIQKGGCFLETPCGNVDARLDTQLECIRQSLEETFEQGSHE
jgi:flagellar biosynthesis/type III secretory pathway protein FliH